MSDENFLFVYGTLRRGHDGRMARWLAERSRLIGLALAAGRLYRVADYPGFVPGDGGQVVGDLLALADVAATLAALDDYEECSDLFPAPHEYRRERIMVDGPDGAVTAWTYIYALPASGLALIDNGDFKA
ncbi:gamma-glutamylcyclotransferase (GGCT)/AIG2-like uncharacterized protein YtfP [Sphingobium fontiphilum]|uniref:Gamma-glutamylcyclotransferase (GGCT)/AIG2-like uncharacterized protein YtfP n=1 Tax=Sphingobium fontiphilum TaxID=944425 RepID=A0A7W6GNG9_9SPHN|nr:gamma-glutamylcyclotransferase family protein [Sphingobium fontiphilum]MBB3981800.1 gamma-glutamylcyclotransferase (GGCT)/AIG2-like uncharacterized protein YtfP [Sphingobium fontiphilum]